MADSAAGEWSVVCSRAWLHTAAGTLRMAGLLVGSALFGGLSDWLGRVPALTLAGLTLFLSQVHTINSA